MLKREQWDSWLKPYTPKSLSKKNNNNNNNFIREKKYRVNQQKKTKAIENLALFHNGSMLLMVEKGIRGVIFQAIIDEEYDGCYHIGMSNEDNITNTELIMT